MKKCFLRILFLKNTSKCFQHSEEKNTIFSEYIPQKWVNCDVLHRKTFQFSPICGTMKVFSYFCLDEKSLVHIVCPFVRLPALCATRRRGVVRRLLQPLAHRGLGRERRQLGSVVHLQHLVCGLQATRDADDSRLQLLGHRSRRRRR